MMNVIDIMAIIPYFITLATVLAEEEDIDDYYVSKEKNKGTRKNNKKNSGTRKKH